MLDGTVYLKGVAMLVVTWWNVPPALAVLSGRLGEVGKCGESAVVWPSDSIRASFGGGKSSNDYKAD